MGADIHMFVEYSCRSIGDEVRWNAFSGEINGCRDYELFALLANVRGSGALFAPRGLPDAIGWEAEGAFYRLVSYEPALAFDNTPLPLDEREVTADTAEMWVQKYGSHYRGTRVKNGKPLMVSQPDWHRASWLTAAEFRKVLEARDAQNPAWKVHISYWAVLAAMAAFDRASGHSSRLVFWFDN